jgi:hypothetical protein
MKVCFDTVDPLSRGFNGSRNDSVNYNKQSLVSAYYCLLQIEIFLIPSIKLCNILYVLFFITYFDPDYLIT